MSDEKNWHIAVITILVFVIGGLFVYSITGANANEDTKISVTGTAERTVAPDEVALYLSVETLEWGAVDSQEANAEIFEQVKAQLLLNGIKEENIKTTYYSIYESEDYGCYYYDNIDLPVYQETDLGGYISECDYEFEGYKTIHTIEVISTDIEDSGELLDDVVRAGATVDYVYFQLSDELKEEIENELISEAVDNAEAKAGNIALSAGMELGKLSSATYGNIYYYGIYKDYYEMAAAEDSSGASTSVQPGQIDLSISVSAVFEAK